MVVFKQSGYIGSEVIVFGHDDCLRTKPIVLGKKEVVFGQNWLYSGKVALFGQSGCIRAKEVVFG